MDLIAAFSQMKATPVKVGRHDDQGSTLVFTGDGTGGDVLALSAGMTPMSQPLATDDRWECVLDSGGQATLLYDGQRVTGPLDTGKVWNMAAVRRHGCKVMYLPGSSDDLADALIGQSGWWVRAGHQAASQLAEESDVGWGRALVGRLRGRSS